MDNNGSGNGRPTRVYLVRHGITDWNAEQRLQGHRDIPLNETGLNQACAVARWLSQQPITFTALYTSDLARAVQTAQVIGAQIGLEPISSTALREINCGDWEGLTRNEIDAQYPQEQLLWRANRYTYPMPGGENVPAVQGRATIFYWNTVQHHPGETIVMVTHGMAILALVAALRGVHIGEYWQQKTFIENTSVTVISHANDQVQLELFNSIAHLPE